MAQTPERKKLYQLLSVEISNEFAARINQRCQQQGISKSQLARIAINKYLNE